MQCWVVKLSNKIIKLAVLRSDDSGQKCPFGLSIPSACGNVGETIDKMFPADGTELSDEEKQEVKKANNFLSRWQSTGEKCKYAGQIIKHDVNCNFGTNDAGMDIEKAPLAAPFYPKVYNNTAYDGVFTAPIGYYADYDLMRNSYYGLYSLQGSYDINEINKFAGYIEWLDDHFLELDKKDQEFLIGLAEINVNNAVLIKKATIIPKVNEILVILSLWKENK